MTQTFVCRLFGGRDVGITYDPVANTLAAMGQTLNLSGVPATLVSNLQSAVANLPDSPIGVTRGAYGGDNIGQAIGAILDNQPTWRNAVNGALTSYVSGIRGIGGASFQQIGEPESWNR